MQRSRISKDEALSFLLTYIVVECATELVLNQIALFKLTQLAQDAANRINQEEDIIPHEIIEAIATEYLQSE